MNDKIIEDFRFDFDIRNHAELSPYMFVTEPSIFTSTKDSFENVSTTDSYHEDFYNHIFNEVESAALGKRYYGTDKEKTETYKNEYKRSVQNLIQLDNRDSSIENQFDHIYDISHDQIRNLERFVSSFKKKMKRDFKQMPISTARFPHYHQKITNYFFYDDNDDEQINNDTNQNDEEKLSNIIQNSQKGDFLISFENLNEFLQNLSIYKSAFSLSPTFVISTLKYLNFALDSSISKDKNSLKDLDDELIFDDLAFYEKLKNLPPEFSNDEKNLRIKYFQLILLIKIRLFLIIQRLHECSIIVLLFVLMEQENMFSEIGPFSFRKIFCESFPQSKERSKIIQNISSEKVIDFCLSPFGKNDFVLTSDGLFRIDDQSESLLNPVDLNENERSQIQEILKKGDKSSIKISFSDGILYFLSKDEQTIFRFPIPFVEEIAKKPKKENNYKGKETKKENKKVSKKKERKIQRKIEKNLIEKVELDTEKVKISVPDFPVFAMDAYDSYVRILQRKSYNNGKTVFILTNVDLNPSRMTNFDATEIFQKSESDKVSQTQIEFSVEDKDNKINNVSLSKELVFVSYDDSTIQTFMACTLNDPIPFKCAISPYILSENSRIKIDQNSFLYVLEPVEKDHICINRMYLNETKHYIRSESSFFIKHPYLHNFSNIIDNSAQFILNREITKEITSKEYYEYQDRDRYDDDEKKKKKPEPAADPYLHTVSPEEMSYLVQSPGSMSDQFKSIIAIIKKINDADIKQFFICMLMKVCGVSILYSTGHYFTTKEKMTESAKKQYAKFKLYITDLYSLYDQSKSMNYEIMIKEALLFSLSLSAKFMFLSDFDALHEFVNNAFNESSHECSFLTLKSMSNFLFSHPSSLYIVNKSLYNLLNKYNNDIDIHQLFTKTLLFFLTEKRFAEKVIDLEFIENIEPYIQTLFCFVRFLINDESSPLIKVEEIMTYLMGFSINNPYYSLLILKNINEIVQPLYNRIRNTPGVLESDSYYCKRCEDIFPQIVTKETKVIESPHPYNTVPPKEVSKSTKSKVIEDLGYIDFGSKADCIYCYFDNRTDISNNDCIMITSSNDKYGPEKYSDQYDFSFNQATKFECNKLKVEISRKDKDDDKEYWGYKITFVGVSFDNQFYWIPNAHLCFYNLFITYLANIFDDAYTSTSRNKDENDLQFILDSKIIQGIKFEDIDNYEASLNSNQLPTKPLPSNNNDNNNGKNKGKLLSRTLTRGISRGISYDAENDSSFDDNFKKSFIKDLINVDKNKQTRGKQLLDILYAKTAKQNRIRLNNSTKRILEIEHYLAACLFKQLGLINLCLKFINKIIVERSKNNNVDDIEIPSRIKSMWKKIYSLRQTLFFSYQKSKTNTNSKSLKLNFNEYSEEIKRKCILLLYSDPILKFKEKKNLDNETIDEAAKSIFTFVTSEIPLTNISKFIDIRRKRVFISTQALSFMTQIISQDIFFESSKYIYLKNARSFSSFIKFTGVSQAETDELNNLFSNYEITVLKNIYSDPSFCLITNHEFLKDALFLHENKEARNEISKTIISILEKKRDFKSFAQEYINIVMIIILTSIAIENENSELTDYIASLLFNEKIDLFSKKFILLQLSVFPQLFPELKKINDKSLALTFLYENRKTPILAKYTFYWLSSVMNSPIEQSDSSNGNPYLQMNSSDFILYVLKGIGQSFIGQSCLFLDDSFSAFSHRQFAESMISFIRILINSQDEITLSIVHKLLFKTINNIKFNDPSCKNDLMTIIGLFACIGHSLSSFEPERKFITNARYFDFYNIIGYNSTQRTVRFYNESNKKIAGGFINAVVIDQKNVDLSQAELDNIIHLHESIVKSKYFTEQPNYENEINETEISENILIALFYSALPVIMQNKNNACLLLSKANLGKALELFDFSKNSIPTNENSIPLLSHYLENAINNPQYKPKDIANIVDSEGSFRFLKMNYGEIIYNKDKPDVIKTIKDHDNLFVCNRPFDSNSEVYFEVKISKIGNKQIYIGFIDSKQVKLKNSFGFGCTGNSKIFCRRSRYLAKELNSVGDELMDNESDYNNNDNDNSAFNLNEGDIIGCYYTPDFVYLTLNGKVTEYRLSHQSIQCYIPLIYVDHDDVELEIVQNAVIIKESKKNFDFLNIKNLPSDYFNSTDIKDAKRIEGRNNSQDFKEKKHFIGQQVFLCKSISTEKKAKMENIDVYSKESFEHRELYGIIKDIITNENNRFVSKLKIESYNYCTLSKEILNYDIDSRYIKGVKTSFLSLIENKINTKLGFNNSFDLKYLPEHLKTTSNIKSITSYLRTKIINDNSKSIGIICTRYLAFILVDYLKYSKSTLLQDEGIESEESKRIIQALAMSIPTFTSFRPKFLYSIDKDCMSPYMIFYDEEEDDNQRNKKRFYQIPGFSKAFNLCFRIFVMKSENIISSKFFTKLLDESLNQSIEKDVIPCSSLYQLLQPDEKIESIYPLPTKSLHIKKKIKRNKMREIRSICYIPLLLSPIPQGFPSVHCSKRYLREQSDKNTHLSFFTDDDVEFKWKYDMRKLKRMKSNKNINFKSKDFTNFRLKFGILILPKDLPENLLTSSLSFIQILYILFQSFNDSSNQFDNAKDYMTKEFMNKFFALVKKNDPLIRPFLSVLLVNIVSIYGFSDSLFYENAKNASYIFGDKLVPLNKMEDFPSSQNELPLLFSIFSNLSQTRVSELLSDNNEQLKALFEQYNGINNQLFEIDDKNVGKKDMKFLECEYYDDDESRWRRYRRNRDDDEKDNKKKNFRNLYLIFYYSLLLCPDKKLPSPMFLFVREWMEQQFGGFRTTISKRDINLFDKIDVNEDKEIIYKSETYQNNNNLSCSYQMINIIEKENSDDDDDSDSDDSDSDLDNCFLSASVSDELDDTNTDENKDKNNSSKKGKKAPPKLEKYKVFVRQLSDDKQIEIPKTGEVDVSFPLEILVIHEKGKKNKKEKLKKGSVFIINFSPSKEKKLECFIENYEQIQNDFKDFNSISKFDNELFDKLDSKHQTSNNENSNANNNNNNNENNNNNNNENNNNENNNNNNNNNNNSDSDDSDDDDESSISRSENGSKSSENDFLVYRLDKIPTKLPVTIKGIPSNVSDRVISLRHSIIQIYSRLVENMMLNYKINDDDDDKYNETNWWLDNYNATKKHSSQYMKQIILPAYSMKTETKFIFINNILSNENSDSSQVQLIFNRFEDQNFMSQFEHREKVSDSSSSTKLNKSLRPLFVQLLEQVNEDSIALLKIRGDTPFRVNLVGEAAIDGGGPSREIFSSLVVQMMNEHIGIFTFNPNYRHMNKDTNQEDLIPNTVVNLSDEFNEEYTNLLGKRFVFAGALIGICIVSSLPQTMKLSSMVWEYLTSGTVSIESIYEIDNNFKDLIQNAENVLNSNGSSDLKDVFDASFEIKDSFDKKVELIQSGSNVKVNRENLRQFIELAKNYRIHEFDDELQQIKEGFDLIMTYKNITSILHPYELKLLVGGEPNCSIKQMKKLIELSTPYLRKEKISEEEMTAIFWDAMESFSPKERMEFIRFATGNLGLPAPGLKWDDNMSVNIGSREEKEVNGKNMLYAATCSSNLYIPFFESKEELVAMIRKALKFSGLISDHIGEIDVSLFK